MMRHDPKWATFNSAYINEKVQFHLQDAFLDEPTEDSLIGMLSHIGLMRDPRASEDMVPDEVWEKMPPNPEIIELEAERAQLKDGQYRIRGTENETRVRELTRKIATKQAQRDKAIRREFRAHYFHNRPTWDVERHASGDEEEDRYIEPTMDLHPPERARLAEILCNQPDDSNPLELLELRIEATELMIALCGKTETVKRHRTRRKAAGGILIKEESPGPDPFPLLMHRTQCPRCIGDNRLSYEERTFQYCRPAVMHDHFDTKHAGRMSGSKQITCCHPRCHGEELEFKDLCHFKNHVERIHGVKLRP